MKVLYLQCSCRAQLLGFGTHVAIEPIFQSVLDVWANINMLEVSECQQHCRSKAMLRWCWAFNFGWPELVFPQCCLALDIFALSCTPSPTAWTGGDLLPQRGGGRG